MTFAVDFDGTVVTHNYPEVGKNIGAEIVLKKLAEKNHKICLNTMRCDDKLDDAVQWFKDNDIEVYGVNENPSQKSWTSSPKVFADYYIDDMAIGCPVIIYQNRRFVDWIQITIELMLDDIFTFKESREVIKELKEKYPQISNPKDDSEN